MDTLADFFPTRDLCAYRAYLGALTPIPTVEDVNDAAQSLDDASGVLFEPGLYTVSGVGFDLMKPGVYRFQPQGRPGQQIAILPDTVSGIASIAAELGALGNLDRNKSWPDQQIAARRRRLSMHCVQFSELSARLANAAGLMGCVWLMWNYDAVSAGDFLSSHSISEIQTNDGSEKRLFDLSFGVELVVVPGQTTFASFQDALVRNDAIEVLPISATFGFEYGSKFFGGFGADFELDALATDPRVLLEAHRRLVCGSYVIGKDFQGRSFSTSLSKALATRADLEPQKLGHITRAQTIPSRTTPDDITDQSNTVRLSSSLVGYTLSTDGVAPLRTTEEASSPLDPAAIKEQGVPITAGARIRIGEDALDLTGPGLHRFKSEASDRPLQILTIGHDKVSIIAALLEMTACGGLHNRLSSQDLKMVAQNEKIIAQGNSLLALLNQLLAPLKVQHQVWRVPTVLSQLTGWPVEAELLFVEIAAPGGQVRLVELSRGLAIRGNGAPCGFAKLEQIIEAGGTVEVRSIRRTPSLHFGSCDAESGLLMDTLLPLWLGSEAISKQIIVESIAQFPALRERLGGPNTATRLSKSKAGKIATTNSRLAKHLNQVLSAAET